MPESVVKEFEKLSHEMSAELIVKLNNWLSEKKRAQSTVESDEPKHRIGLGVYYFKNDDQGE